MDSAHKWTEREINRLSRRLGRVYGRASSEARAAYDKALADYARDRAEMAKALDSKAFEEWCMYESLRVGQRGQVAEQLAYDLALADVKAREIADGVLPGIYAHNYNFAIGQIESQLVGKVPEGFGLSFTLLDEHTARKLITENPRLLPIPDTVAKNSAKFSRAVAYNKRQITAAVRQGILQGESVPNIAKRIGTVYSKSANAAVRYARTACTCAENAGRLESYKEADKLGIEMEKEWIATGDSRTRDTHLEADGQTVPVDEPFIVGNSKMDEPGDPAGGGEAWNCRCTMAGKVKGFRESLADRLHREEIEAESQRRARG